MSKGTKTAADSLSVTLASDTSIPAGSAHIGQVNQPLFYVTITPTVLNNDAYDSGDVLWDSAAIAGAVRTTGGSAILQSLCLIDKDDQGVAMTLVFMSASQSLGTKDSAPDIDDTEVLDVIGHVEIASGDYKDLGANRIATVRNIGLVVTSATTTVYVAAITGGTPTHTTGGIRLKLGFLQA